MPELPPQSCGNVLTPGLLHTWSDQERAWTDPLAGARTFTWECWLQWPEFPPADETLATMEASGWGWSVIIDANGCLSATWWSGTWRRTLRGPHLGDQLHAGIWYHVAFAFEDRTDTDIPYINDYCLAHLLVTPAGALTARTYALDSGFSTPASTCEGATLRLGGGRLTIASAAFHGAVLAPAAFTALGRAIAPAGITIHADFPSGSLTRYALLPDGTIAFNAAILTHFQNFWWAFRIDGGQGRELAFRLLDGNPMAHQAWISEDNGVTWKMPSSCWRHDGRGPAGRFDFAICPATSRTLVAAGPLVTVDGTEAWIDRMAQRPGVRTIAFGVSKWGRPLRALEIGNPDAPLVWLQAGQHSHLERIGFHACAGAFAHVVEDPALQRLARWAILPIVSGDDDLGFPHGDPNLNRRWGSLGNARHATVEAIAAHLSQEAVRTGLAALVDWHSGPWPTHTLLLPRHDDRTRDLLSHLEHQGFAWASQLSAAKTAEHGGRTAAAWASDLPGEPVALTAELSVRTARQEGRLVPVTISHLMVQGAALAKGLGTWLHQRGNAFQTNSVRCSSTSSTVTTLLP